MDFRITNLGEIDSTNQYLSELYQKGRACEGTVVTAFNQYSGKGQDQNVWHSEPGKNLLMSVLLNPRFLDPSLQFRLNKVISISAMKAISRYITDKAVRIKWPNDIYVENRKIAGILIRHYISGATSDATIAGIGINVCEENFPAWIPNPCSILTESGREFQPEEILTILLQQINHNYENLRRGLHSKLDKAYIENLYRRGEWYEYIIRGNRLTANISDIDLYGRLLLKDKKGNEYCCDLKEIEYGI